MSVWYKTASLSNIYNTAELSKVVATEPQPSPNRSSRNPEMKYVPISYKISRINQLKFDLIRLGYLITFRIYFTNLVKQPGAGAHPKGRPTAW